MALHSVPQEHTCCVCIDQLRAHVAALVKALSWMRDHLIAQEKGNECFITKEVAALLDAPDLAALVAREQAREAFIEASKLYWNQPSGSLCDEVMRTLRALDAAEGK